MTFRAFFLIFGSVFSLSCFAEAPLKEALPKVEELPSEVLPKENRPAVYGTFGVNAGLVPTFNATVGYQGKRLGGDIQTNLFLELPMDVSTHLKRGQFTKNGNYYVGVGPFWSQIMGFGGEIITGYRSIPKSGLGFFVEAFGRPFSTAKPMTITDENQDTVSDIQAGVVGLVMGTGYAGIRAGIAF